MEGEGGCVVEEAIVRDLGGYCVGAGWEKEGVDL